MFFTGNDALNGGLVGAGLGALGATIFGPAVGGALNNGNFNNGNSCGKRRKRQAEDGETRFFLPGGGSCTCNTGRRRRQAVERKDGGDKRTDNTGRSWCYTTGWGNSGCGDLQTSKRFPNNPWSYTACGYNG